MVFVTGSSAAALKSHNNGGGTVSPSPLLLRGITKTMLDIMFDLETWGTSPGADIRSIGACVFNPVTGYVGSRDKPGETFYIACENPIVDPSVEPGFDDGLGVMRRYNLKRDPSTVEWWNKQGEEAQNAFSNPVELPEALYEFSTFVYDNVGDRGNELQLWCKGPHFDEAILGHVYRMFEFPLPWEFWTLRDVRTALGMAGMSRFFKTTRYTGTLHNALDDAISQAHMVCEAYERVSKKHVGV